MKQDKTFERIAELIGGSVDGSCVFGVKINENYFITVCHMINRPYRMTLVKDAHTGNGLDNICIAYEIFHEGASDKVIMNRFNKLIALAK